MASRQDNAASVRGVALRVTRLAADGTPAVGTACDSYVTGGFIKFGFNTAYNTGNEIQVTNGAGSICTYYRMPDTIKNVAVTLELCDPDPVLTQLLTGGVVLGGNLGDAGVYSPVGAVVGDTVAMGYAAEHAGVENNPYGVAIEVWATAVVGGKAAAQSPFWHYVIPYAKLRLNGDRVVESGNLATAFAGEGGGNSSFGTGPNMSLVGVSPTPTAGAFDWKFPTVTDRPFAYARADNAPVGLVGVFANLGVPPTAVTPGFPATLTPVNATRPANLAALVTLGALGSTSAWPTGSFLVLADGTRAYWNATTWIAGTAPAPVITATSATAGTPGTFGPTGATPPANLTALQASSITAVPTTAWTTGQRVVLGDATTAHWSSSAWVAGAA